MLAGKEGVSGREGHFDGQDLREMGWIPEGAWKASLAWEAGGDAGPGRKRRNSEVGFGLLPEAAGWLGSGEPWKRSVEVTDADFNMSRKRVDGDMEEVVGIPVWAHRRLGAGGGSRCLGRWEATLNSVAWS